ncbi:hypothetical protein EYR38_008018 [Pleurotus pulmonarius]|nr:hypothetical protein EYR38_008018 [Pleurotus pulmonarius]
MRHLQCTAHEFMEKLGAAYIIEPRNACVCVSFALELFFNVSAAAAQTPASRNWKLFIASLPYVTPFLVCIEIGLSRHDVVKRNAIGMYCHFTISTPSIITGIIVIFVMISVLPVVSVTIFMFIRNWGTLRNLCAEQNGGLPLRLVIRYGVFCLLPVPIVTISLVSWQFEDASPNAANVAVAIATLPIMTALIFGTQWDIFRVWMFWRRKSPQPTSRTLQFKPRISPPSIPYALPQEEIELDTKPKYCEA